MKISVTKVRKTRSTYIDLTDEALSATIDIVTITEHRVNFLVEMSDGRSYESTTTVAGTDSYSDCMGIDSPIDDLAKFHEALGKLVIQDLDASKYGDILDEAAAQFVHYYGASRNPNYPGRETIRSVANRLNQIDN